MAFSLQPKRKPKKTGKGLFLFALMIMAVFTIFPGSFVSFSTATNAVAVPFWNAGNSVRGSFSSFFTVLRFKNSLIVENQKLKEEVARLKRDLEGYDVLAQQNIEYSEMLLQKKEDGIFAGVVARPNVTEYDTILIDIGTEAGVKKGNLVQIDDNVAIGTVYETYPYSSKVRLFSSPGRTTDIFLGPKNIAVSANGEGGGALLSEVPKELDIKEGDAAVLSGSSGLIIAYVNSIEKNENDSFQKIRMTSPVSIFEMKFVQVIPAPK